MKNAGRWGGKKEQYILRCTYSDSYCEIGFAGYRRRTDVPDKYFAWGQRDYRTFTGKVKGFQSYAMEEERSKRMLLLNRKGRGHLLHIQLHHGIRFRRMGGR